MPSPSKLTGERQTRAIPGSMMPGKARRGGMVRTSVAGAHQKLSSLARVHKRKNKAAFDADSRNVPVKYSDTVSEDKRRVNLLYLTRRSDPLGIVWDLRHIGFTALPRVLRSVNTVAVVSVYLTTAVTTRLGYWSYDSSVNTADDDLTALAGMELLVTFNLCAASASNAFPRPRCPDRCTKLADCPTRIASRGSPLARFCALPCLCACVRACVRACVPWVLAACSILATATTGSGRCTSLPSRARTHSPASARSPAALR